MVSEEECIFCKIVRGEIPSNKVYEDEHTLAFLDINPRNPGHTLVIPKKHHEQIFTLSDQEGAAIFSSVKKVAALVKNGVKADGISIAQNNGKAAGQVVWHVHFHVIPRFEAENPPALEGILSVKKMTPEVMQKIADTIKNASSKPQESSKQEQPTEFEKEEQKTEDDIDFNFE